MRTPAFLGSVVLLGTFSCPAQFTLTVPDAAYATREGNSNFTLPWNAGTAGGRVQFIHDSAVFTGQGVTTPIRISGLRYRIDAIANTWSGGTYPNVQIDMSTCPVDHLAVSNTFANNHGADRTTVLNGAVVVTGGTGGNAPSGQYVDITLTTPFLYDPTTGSDLLVDFTVGTGWTPNAGLATGPVDHVGPGGSPAALGSRVWISGSPTSTTGNANFSPTLGYSPVCDFVYSPAVGLWPNFSASPTTGVTPLLVQFTDLSVTDDPSGIVGWQWDLDGDSVIDSTSQNPTFTYTNCGSYSVTLAAIDALHGLVSITKANIVVTDRIDAGFTYTILPGNVVAFTDTTSPPATAWAWDFDGDTIVDSTLQNPTWNYPPGCRAYQVSLTANRLCGPSDTAQAGIALAPNSLATMTPNQGFFGALAGNLFDVNVLHPDGINICAITTNPYTDGTLPLGSPLGCELWVTDAAGGYASNHANAAVWRLAATGAGFYQGGNSGSPRPITMTLDRPVYLPSGTFGFAVYMVGSGISFRSLATTTSNADLSITAGSAKSATRFGASQTAARSWSGTLHYDTLTTGAGAAYGFFGAGCAGSSPVTNLIPANLPQLGATFTVNLNNMPTSAAFFLVGFSRTSSPFGPLPVDLSVYGMPGCRGRVSPDATLLLIGSGNAATWNFGIPNTGSMVGLHLYNQAIVLDPGFNALGAVASDAAALLIGN